MGLLVFVPFNLVYSFSFLYFAVFSLGGFKSFGMERLDILAMGHSSTCLSRLNFVIGKGKKVVLRYLSM